MFKRLMQLLTPSEESSSSPQKVPLAAAVLLLEVAYADGHYLPEEEAVIGEVLQQHFGVEPQLMNQLLALAQEERQTSSDLHQFTREINLAFSQEEKEAIIEAIWRLVYADGRLSRFEEALMRQLGTLIGLSHRQLIEAKLRVVKS